MSTHSIDVAIENGSPNRITEAASVITGIKNCRVAILVTPDFANAKNHNA